MKEFKGNNIEVDQNKDADIEGVDMSIDAADMGFIFDVLFNQMYRDPIGSVIREITSNCFDSHIEANVPDAVVIEMGEDDGGEFISFQDIGIGISPERMAKVYSKPTKSTKRDSDDQHGYWGLGSKSPLAYADNFQLSTVYNGIVYEYVVHRGAKKPRIDKLSEEPCTDRNGSTVKIYIKSSDASDFRKKLRVQLRYFDNVYVKGVAGYNNEYTIYEGEHFKFRNDIHLGTELHICIGKVYYPIDWEKLGIDKVELPVALKFNIGELPITPERESIRYMAIEEEGNDELIDTRNIIKDKIDALYNELQDMLPEDFFEHNNIFDYTEAVKKPIYVTILDRDVIITKLFKEVKPHLYMPLAEKGLSVPVYPLGMYSCKFMTQSHSEGLKVQSTEHTLRVSNFDDSLIVRMSDSINKLKAIKVDYLRKLAQDDHKPIVRFVGSNSNYAITSIIDSLEIPSIETRDFSKINKMRAWKYFKSCMQKELIANSIDYDTLIIDDDFEKHWKLRHSNKRTVKVDDDEIPFDNFRVLRKTDRRQAARPKNLGVVHEFIIYGFQEDEDWLEYYATCFHTGEFGDYLKVGIFRIRLKDEKLFIPLKNSIYVKSFMSNNPVFVKVATSLIIRKSSIWNWGFKAVEAGHYNTGQITTVAPHKVPLMEVIFTPFVNTMNELEKISKSTVNIDGIERDDKVKFTEEVIKVAEENNWIDPEVKEKVVRCEKYLEKLELLNYVIPDDTATPHIVEFLQLKGKKVNPEWVKMERWQIELLLELDGKANYLSETCIVGRTWDGMTSKDIHEHRSRRDKNSKSVERYKELIKVIKPIIDYQNGNSKGRQEVTQ